jgi:manganese transport system substrate-binding protein
MLLQRSFAIEIQIAVLGCAAILGLTGCGSSIGGDRGSETQNAANLKAKAQGQKMILTTFTVLADMGQNVAGDKALVQSLVKPGAEIHGYEPTPKDLVRAQDADLILDNGLNLERWADRFYNSVPKVPHITLSSGVEPVAIAQDAQQGKPNPHAWMSPQNALLYVENIRKALATLDPANAEVYARNAAAYSQQIKALDRKLRKEVESLPSGQRYLVSCEGAFSYIARDYGLKEVYLWAVNSEQQAAPQQIERVINTVKANQIPAVFCESTVNDKAQRQVAKETKAKFGGVFFVDSLSPPEGPASTYLKLLEHNITTLIQGLKG